MGHRQDLSFQQKKEILEYFQAKSLGRKSMSNQALATWATKKVGFVVGE